MNASLPLVISTGDGSGQCVHPDVAHDPAATLAYPYLMVCTPYPWGNDRLENPLLRVSNDGIGWHSLPGTPEPLVEPPEDPDAHNADPDLVVAGGKLYVVFMTRNKRELRTTFSVVESADGRSWSRPRVIYEGKWGVSPALAYAEDTWRMWYIRLDVTDPKAEADLLLRRGSTLDELGGPTTCRLVIPGHVPWHIDVIQNDGTGWEALVAAFPRGKDNSRTKLFHCVSEDGVSFELTRPEPILIPSKVGWDGMMVYRASFLREADHYRVWYTGGSWNRRFGIGHVTGPMHDLAYQGRKPTLFERFRFGIDNLLGFGKHAVKRLLRPTLGPILRRQGH